MNFFLLPHSYPFTYRKLDYYVSEDNTEPKLALSHSLSKYLYEIKEKIKMFDQDWDIFKEYTNPYEYIHTQAPTLKHSVSVYKPLSRSYYKMVEILTHFDLLKHMPTPGEPIRTFHLAEGPGGFIEALANMRKTTNPQVSIKDSYIGMTLLDDTDRTIPSWKKSQTFMRNNPTVTIENGQDGTGNLLSVHNFIYCVQKYGSSMDLITADGGFDFSDNFNRQEAKILPLLYAQIAYAVCMQKKGGHFILKIFDCFMEATVDLMYLLTSFYERVFVTKPQTSRYANSERYIVCIGFHFDHYADHYPYILSAFTKMCITPVEKTVRRFLNVEMPMYFMNRLEESNMVIGMNQIDNIYVTITLMENNKNTRKVRIDHLIRVNVIKCTQWCLQHSIQVLSSLNNTLTPENLAIIQDTASVTGSV